MKFYRFRSISTNTYQEIINNEVWYSRLNELNDPFEGLFINNSNEASLNHLVGNLAVCCFSLSPESLLMWAHYTDSHRGLCLEYEIPDKEFKETFMKVDYSPIMPVIEKVRRFPLGHQAEGCLAVNIHKEAKVFTTKSEDWSYETEYRIFIILTDSASKGELRKFPGKLTSVYFGLRTPQREIATINKVLEGKKHIKFAKTTLRKNTYEIRFETIDRSKI